MPIGIGRRLDMETLVEEHYPAPTAATGVFKDTDEYDWEMLTSDIDRARLAAQEPVSLPLMQSLIASNIAIFLPFLHFSHVLL